MEVICGVKPQEELLLPLTFTLGEHVSVEDIRVYAKVAKEFKVNLIPRRPLRRKLHRMKTQLDIRFI